MGGWSLEASLLCHHASTFSTRHQPAQGEHNRVRVSEDLGVYSELEWAAEATALEHVAIIDTTSASPGGKPRPPPTFENGASS